MGKSQMQMNKQVFGVTALMAALMGVYGTANSAEPPLTINAANSSLAAPYALDQALAYTSVKVTLGGFGTGSGVTITNTDAGAGTGSLQSSIVADNQAVLTLTGGSIATTGAQFTRGILATTGAKISTNGTAISTMGNKSHAVHAWSSAPDALLVPEVNIVGGTISTRGDESWGAYAQRTGKITGTGVAITTAGKAGFGAFAEDGGQIALDGGSITTTGGALPGGQVGSFGVLTKYGSTANLSNLSVTTAGDYAEGVRSEGGGLAPTVVDAANLVVRTGGVAASGIASYNEGSVITVRDSSITTTGDPVDTSGGPKGSRGVWAEGGGLVNISDSNVTTNGAVAQGLRAANGTLTVRSRINATNTSVTTNGQDSAGVAVSNGGRVIMTGGSIAANGAGSPGIRLGNNADISLTGVKVVAAGASIVSSFDTAGKTHNIAVGSGTTLAQNNGTLLKVTRTGAGIDGVVKLDLAAGSFASGNIVNFDAAGALVDVGDKTKVMIDPNAHWAGIVVGAADKIVDEGASVRYDSTPITGNVVPAANSTVTFDSGAHITGSVSASQGSTTSFNGPTTITQNMVGQGAAVSFGGATQISNSVTATGGSNFTFAGSATIGSGTGTALAGQGSSFVFSQTAPTAIQGSVVLSEGSSLRGGTTATPITVSGDTVVGQGSTLGGNLFVSGALGGSGGNVAPGNSVGTQSYGTSSGFVGTYKAEVNAAGKSDLVIIRSGNLDLSGIDLRVAQENGNGGYVLNHDYTVVQTVDGNVVNTFKSTELDSSFANTLVSLDPVKYSAKDAKVSLSVDPTKVGNKRAGLSGNQNATLDGALSVAGRNASADAALQSTDTRGALNQLSGEVHGSTESALLNSGGLVQRTISNRMRGNVGAGMMAGAPTAQASGAAPAGSMPSSAAYPLWAQVVGDWNTSKSNDNTAKAKTSLGGLFVGGDAAVGKGWRLGGALGFTDGNITVDDRSSKADVRSYTASVYGGNSWAAGKGSVNFLVGAAYTRHDINTRRGVTVGGNQTLKADYDANAVRLFTEVGYALPVGQASVIEPYLGVAWLNQRAKGFSESGGPAALSGESRTDNVTTTTLGLRGKTVLDVGGKQATLSAGLGWRRAAGDVNPTRQLAFVQGNGAAFKVEGAPIAKNAAVVDLGAEMAVGKNAAMGLGYSGQFGQGNSDSAGTLYLKVRF